MNKTPIYLNYSTWGRGTPPTHRGQGTFLLWTEKCEKWNLFKKSKKCSCLWQENMPWFLKYVSRVQTIDKLWIRIPQVFYYVYYVSLYLYNCDCNDWILVRNLWLKSELKGRGTKAVQCVYALPSVKLFIIFQNYELLTNSLKRSSSFSPRYTIRQRMATSLRISTLLFCLKRKKCSTGRT